MWNLYKKSMELHVVGTCNNMFKDIYILYYSILYYIILYYIILYIYIYIYIIL